ncbi:MAG: trigger factor [Clostridium sp.]|nr:trigger factor [Clostridium sp.]
MMKKQRLGAIVLTGVLVLSMTGCGNSKAKAYSKYVTLGEYKGIEYTQNVEEVTDEAVQQQVDSFLESKAENSDVTGRAVKNGDIVNIDYVGTMDGVAFEGGTAEGQDLEIGSGSFIPGFEDGLIGHDIKEEVSLDIQFPDPYPNDPDKAGKDVNFKVTINSIKVKEVPKLTDDFVKENTEYDTIDAYKASIREDLEEQNKNSAEQQARNDIFNKAVENCQISGYDEEEVKQLVDDEFKSFKETAENYESYGYSYEDVLSMHGYDTEDALKEGITNYVKQYLNQKMVLYCIADAEGITVSSEETDKKVEEYMETYGVETKEEVYDYFGDDYFEVALLSEKVIEFLKENAVLVDSIEEEADSEEEKDSEEGTTASEKDDEEETTTSEEDSEEATTASEESTEE